MALFKKKNNIEETADKKAKAVKPAKTTKAKASSKTTKAVKTEKIVESSMTVAKAPATPSATKTPVSATVADSSGAPAYDFTSVLITPRVTEKATMLHQNSGVYTFNIHNSATKISVAKAIKDVYNVVPRKVRIVHFPAKQVFSRGKRGVKKGGKKAYVYLKAGEKIEVV